MMFFSRRQPPPQPRLHPQDLDRLTARAIADVTPAGEHLADGLRTLETIETLILMALHRARRKFEVLTYGGQQPEVMSLWRNELHALQLLIETMADVDPPMSAAAVERELRSFVEGAR